MKRVKGERFNPYRLFNGIFIPEAIVSLPVKTLSQGAKIAYGRLCRYAGENGEVFPKRETLADEIGCGVRQVDSCLSELKKFGLLESERVGLGRPNCYYFLWHEIFDETQKNVNPDERDTSGQDLKNNLTPSIKESHDKESHIKKNTANAAYSFDDSREVVKIIIDHYREKIHKKAQLSSKSEICILDRLQEYSLEELVKAIDSYSHDNWYMRHHRYNGVEWFFKDQSQIDKWLSLEAEPQKENVVVRI